MKQIIRLSDSSSTFCIDALGDWAQYAFQLGVESFFFTNQAHRLVTVVSVPDRTVFSTLLALGCVVGDAKKHDSENQLTWSKFIELPSGTVIHFADGDRVRSGVIDEIDRAIPDCRWVNTRGKGNSRHSFLKSSFGDKCVSLTGKNDVSPEFDPNDLNVIQFLSELGLSGREDWLKTVYPMTLISTVKRRFTAVVEELSLELEGGNVCTLSSVLKVSENGEPGTGKLLLKTEKSNKFLQEPKVVVLNTRKFEETVRDYAFANLVIVLENREYDDYVSSLVKKLRSVGTELPGELEFINDPPAGVKACSMLLRRELL